MNNPCSLAQEPAKSTGLELPHEDSEMRADGRSKRVVYLSEIAQLPW